MRFGIYGRVYKEEHYSFVKNTIETIKECGYTLAVYETYFPKIKDVFNLPANTIVFNNKCDISEKVDYLISLGGDGTLLDTVNIVKDCKIKVLGINMGRLGFLATINKHKIKEAFQILHDEKYKLDQRTLLHVTSNLPLFEEECFALNEFTMYKREASSMITVHTYIDDEFLNSYWADGLIIATPTGSTGYSLSCGGPVIYPTSKNFVITPIAPHNLNVRPFVVDDNVTLKFKVESRVKDFQVSLDSRSLTLNEDFQLQVKKAAFPLNLIKMPDSSFLETLRTKLYWGADKRSWK